MTTIHVTSSYTVEAGQKLSFDGEDAFFLDQQNPHTSPATTLLNFGRVVVTNGGHGIDADNGTLFWNEAGCTFSVTGAGYVVRYYNNSCNYHPTQFHNSRLFSMAGTIGPAFAPQISSHFT